MSKMTELFSPAEILHEASRIQEGVAQIQMYLGDVSQEEICAALENAMCYSTMDVHAALRSFLRVAQLEGRLECEWDRRRNEQRHGRR